MKKLLFGIILITRIVNATELYLEMEEVVADKDVPHAFIRIPVSDAEEAYALKQQYGSDPDLLYGINFISVIKTYISETEQPVIPVKHEKSVRLEEELGWFFPNHLPIVFDLPAQDDNHAKRIKDKVKQLFPTKTFKGK